MGAEVEVHLPSRQFRGFLTEIRIDQIAYSRRQQIKQTTVERDLNVQTASGRTECAKRTRNRGRG